MFVPLLGLYSGSTGLRPVSPRGLVRALGSVADAVAYGRDVTGSIQCPERRGDRKKAVPGKRLQ